MIFCVAVLAFIISLVVFRPDPKYPKWRTTIGITAFVTMIATAVALLVAAAPLSDIGRNGTWDPTGEKTTYTVAEGSQVTRFDNKISFIAETDAGLQPIELETKESTYLEVRKSDSPKTQVTISTEERSWGYWLTPWETFHERTVIILEN